jgi:hypothetical protein
VIGQRPAHGDDTIQGIGRRRLNTHNHPPIIQQELVAHATIFHQIRVIDAYDSLIARCKGMARGERESIANLQLDPLVSEFCNPNFRALQIT